MFNPAPSPPTCSLFLCYLKAFRDLVRKQKIYLKVRTPYIQSKLIEWQHLLKDNTFDLSKRFTPLGGELNCDIANNQVT